MSGTETVMTQTFYFMDIFIASKRSKITKEMHEVNAKRSKFSPSSRCQFGVLDKFSLLRRDLEGSTPPGAGFFC